MISVRLSGVRALAVGAGHPDNFGHCLALSFCCACFLVVVVVVGASVCVAEHKKVKRHKKLQPHLTRTRRQDMRLIFKFKSHFLRPPSCSLVLSASCL